VHRHHQAARTRADRITGPARDSTPDREPRPRLTVTAWHLHGSRRSIALVTPSRVHRPDQRDAQPCAKHLAHDRRARHPDRAQGQATATIRCSPVPVARALDNYLGGHAAPPTSISNARQGNRLFLRRKLPRAPHRALSASLSRCCRQELSTPQGHAHVAARGTSGPVTPLRRCPPCHLPAAAALSRDRPSHGSCRPPGCLLGPCKAALSLSSSLGRTQQACKFVVLLYY
jgi:hypothetical protein